MNTFKLADGSIRVSFTLLNECIDEMGGKSAGFTTDGIQEEEEEVSGLNSEGGTALDQKAHGFPNVRTKTTTRNL